MTDMANKFIDWLFKRKDNEQQNSAGTTNTSANNTLPTTTTPQYRNNTVVYNEGNGSGIYQQKVQNNTIKDKNEFAQQFQYGKTLGYTNDQIMDLVKNGTRWTRVALGKNNRPIMSYDSGNQRTANNPGFSSKEEFQQQYNYAIDSGMSKEDAFKALASGMRWREQTEEEALAALATPTNAAKDNNTLLNGVYGKAQDRSSSLYKSKYAGILDKEDYAEKSKASGSKTPLVSFGRDAGEIYDYVNDIGDTRKRLDELQRTGGGDGTAAQNFGKYSFMTEDEKGVFNYLYATKGKKAAQEFLDYLEPELDAQWMSGSTAVASEEATKSKGNAALYSAATVLGQPFRTMTATAAVLDDIYRTATGQPINANSELRSASATSSAIRSAISDRIAKYDKKYGIEIAGQSVGSFAYQTTMSALDSAVNMWMASGLTEGLGIGFEGGKLVDRDKFAKAMSILGALPMANEAAALSIAENKQKGYNDLGALTLGMVRGGIEFATEQIGGEFVLKKMGKNPLSFWNTIAQASIPEGVEEVMSEIGNEGVNLLVDALWGTDESFIRNSLAELEAAGSKNPWYDTFKACATNVIMAFLGGAFSSFGSGSVNYVRTNQYINQTAKQLNCKPQEVVDLMNEWSRGKDEAAANHVYQLALLHDAKSIDDLVQKVGEFQNIYEALDNAMVARGEATKAQRSNAAVTAPAEKRSEYDMLHDMALENISAMSQEQLDRYTDLLTQEIQANEQVGNDANQAIADMLKEDLQEAIEEGSRRQNIAEQQTTTTATPEVQTVEQTPSEEYNGTVNTTEGDIENGSSERNAGDDSSVSARVTDGLSVHRPDSGGQGSSGVVQENSEVRGTDSESATGRNLESQTARATDTADRGTGEQRNTRNQAVQRTVSDESSRRVSRIIEAVEKHFNTDKFVKNPVRFYNNIKNFAKFGRQTLVKVFGSQKNAAQFVRAWMNEEANGIIMSPIRGLLDRSELVDEQRTNAYQAYVCSVISKHLLEGRYTAQDIADIGGFSVEEAQKILDGAEKTITQSMADARILNRDGSIKDFRFRKESMAANRKSGAKNTIANLADGQEPGTAQSFELTGKFNPKKTDIEYNDNNKYGNKIYKRGSTFYVVNKGGYIITEADAKGDPEDALREARIAAHKSSPSYDVASVRLFGKDVYFDNGNGMVLNHRNIFTRQNMKSVYGSLASDTMNVKYSDMEKGSRMGSSAWFKLNLGVETGDKVRSLTNATTQIQNLISASMSTFTGSDGKEHRGIKMANGKYYVFFGMTANGAKKGEAIMVDEKYYDELRKKSLGGKTEAEVAKFNPAKYLTASASIFSPSNADTGIKIVETDKETGKKIRRVAVIGDVFTTRLNTLRQFMLVDKAKNSDGSINLESVDYKGLVKMFTDSMVRQLTENGATREEALKQAEEIVPNQVKEIIERNDVGAVLNIMTDLMFQATDGTGFVTLPEDSPYEGQSIQMRSLGGFKAQLIGFKFSDYLHAVIPFNPDAEYLYRGEEGEIAGGFRYQSKEKGVEVLSYWGAENPTEDDWIPVKDLKAILFNSTVKFAGQYTSTRDFYDTVGDADLRSIPRENVYGASVSDSALEGFETRGVGQMLRSQMNFTDDEVKAVLDKRIDLIEEHLRSNPRIAAKFVGADIDGPPPKKSDGKAYALYYQFRNGQNYFETYEGAQWLADKMGKLIESMKQGNYVFKEGEAQHGWIDPDVVGLIRSMTSITRISGQLQDTVGGGFSLNGATGLTPGQVFAANLNNTNDNGEKDNNVALVRYPTMKAIDVQPRENVDTSDPVYKEMVERFGLDKANIYTAINDTLSMYLDNDYDGDPVFAFQGVLADLIKTIRSRDYTDEKGNPTKKNVFVATTKGIQPTEVESADFGPVEFSHAKADKVEITAERINDAVYKYLQVNDTTDKNYKGPRAVGIYANMVDRLASIPDWALQKVADKEGMTVKEYRALMEARFGVASVLSIDYAKTGREFAEFFTMVNDLNEQLYDIAEENGLIDPLPVDEAGNKKKTGNYFVPAWWGDSGNARKEKQYEENPGYRVRGSENLRSAFNRLLPQKAENKSGFASWYNALGNKLYRGQTRKVSWEGAMTADPAAYDYLSDKFFRELNKAYSDIVSKDNPEFIKLQKAYRNANRTDVKDIDIRNYLLYKNLQQRLGLNNEQFTDLILEMLTRNSNVTGTVKSIGTLANYNQNDYDKSNTDLPSAEIFQRNIRLAANFGDATKALTEIDNQINAVGKGLIEARDKISKLLESRKTVLNAVDAAHVKRIADMQNYLEDGNNRLRQNFNGLFKTLRSVRGDAKSMSTDDLDAYRNAYQDMRDQIASLEQQLNSTDSVFASGIAKDVSLVLNDVDKEIRDTLRQIDTLEKSLTELYDAYQRQLSRTEAAANATEGVFTNATTGLEGMTEEDILNKIRGEDNADRPVPDIRTGRQEVQSESNTGREPGRTEDSGSAQEERRSSEGTGAGRGQSVKVNTKAESDIQSENKPKKGHRTLATNDDNETLSVDFKEDGDVEFTVEKEDGSEEKYKLVKGGRIIMNKDMTAAQKKTQNILAKVGIHIVYTTANVDVVGGEHDGKNLGGFSFKGKDVKSGERFIVVNIADKEGRITARHEPIHALLNMLGDEEALAWMEETLSSLTASAKESGTGYAKLLTKKEVNAAIKGIEAVYGKNRMKVLHEFFANLFSGDNFCNSAPDLSRKYLDKFMERYQDALTSRKLNQDFWNNNSAIWNLLSKALPNATNQEKLDILCFFLDDLRPSGPVYARESSTTKSSTAEEATTTTTQQEEVPLPFGKNRKSIARSSSNIQASIQKAITQLKESESIPAQKLSNTLKDFNTTVKMLLKGKATSEELYVAYNKLKGSLFYDETVDPFFDDFIDKNRFENEDAYNEAVDHALAKFAAHTANVLDAENSSENLTKESVKHKEGGAVKKGIDFFGSWQMNAPTWFKSLMGFKKGTEGYKIGSKIETANKNMQTHYWNAYQPIQEVAKMKGFSDLANGKTAFYIPGQITDNAERMSSIEAINLYRMLKSVRYTQGNLSNVKGFTLKDGTKVRTAWGSGKSRIETIGKLYSELDDYFTRRASAVEKAYCKALDEVFDYFTPEVQRVGKKLNGYVDTIPGDSYSPVSWGKGSIEENFDPREAQLKVDPRYMKARAEEAGGYLYAAPMNDVIDTYARRMSDYLAFGELREQLRIMNTPAEQRMTKTLGQIAGENMGQDYARFINNYVRDLIHYSENSDSFWYKARQLMQKGTLVGNPSVMMKQSASYLNAASVIDMKYLMRALGPNKFNGDYANGKSGLLEYRRITGNFDPTITDIFGQKASKSKLVRAFQNGISIIDHATVKRLYVAACLQVEAQGISRNSLQFDEAVENLFSDAVIQTQPQFDASLRAESARTKNEGVRMLAMFRTQQTQNFNKLVTAIGEYQADKNPANKAKLAATISGLAGSALALALFTSVADAMLHRKRKYRDDEDKITPESVANRIAINSAEALAGTVWFGDDLAKFAIDRLGISDSQEFYGLSMGPASTIYDAVTALGELIDAYKEGKNMISASKKFIGYTAQALGKPANNLYNYLNAVTMYYIDHMGENPDGYDDWAKWMDNKLRAQNQLIKAAESGSDKKTNRMWDQLQKRYENPASELNKQLKKDYNRGKVTDDTAINLLITYGGLDDEEAAKKRIAKWEFDTENPDYSDMSESYVWKWENNVKSTGVKLKTYYDAVKYFKKLGEDKTNGNDKNDMLVYLNGLSLNDSQLKAVWSSFGTNFYSAYDAEKGVFAKYEDYAKPAGISVKDFTTYYDHFNNTNSDKDANGKDIKGHTKQDKIIAYIDSLPLTNEQKDALWQAYGYKTTSKAFKNRPWK